MFSAAWSSISCATLLAACRSIDLNDVVAEAIAQDPALGSSVHEFLVRYLFEPLGMRQSSWDGEAPDKNFAFGWSSTARDMVLVVKNIGSNNQRRVWNAIRPTLVALDPTYAGDEEAFCEAYAAGDYAPSL